MNAERLGRLARMLRVRQRLTQVQLATRAGVGRRAVSLLERGRARELTLGVVEAVLSGLGARVDVRVLWNGPELDRLVDAGHAALAVVVKRRLERWGWIVRAEVTYSRYGERGRIDLLAFHAATGVLLVIELKTALVDVQDLLGALDAKARLAPAIARDLGWPVRTVVPMIVITDTTATRSRVAAVDALFDRYERRGRAAISWLRRPESSSPPTGIMWFATVPADRRRSDASAERVYEGRRRGAA